MRTFHQKLSTYKFLGLCKTNYLPTVNLASYQVIHMLPSCCHLRVEFIKVWIAIHQLIFTNTPTGNLTVFVLSPKPLLE